jgi:beta-lactamase superfamily II metal-dependent hydrolase
MGAMNRRDFLRASGGLAAMGAGLPGTALPSASVEIERADRGAGADPEAETMLTPWTEGGLDIHHIHTGRGNSTLVIAPDGTSLLIDAGASGTTGAAMNAARPDESRRPGEWIARYAARQLAAVREAAGVDYALLTHLHGDHAGDVTANSPAPDAGGYQPTGISDVARTLKIGKLIDRGFPNYDFPAKQTDLAALNYIAFARSMSQRGTAVERGKAGALRQIGLKYAPERYPEYQARVVAGDGEVWTGRDETSAPLFPPQAGLKAEQLANENSCSIALRLSYGKFSYFTGGDLNCDTNYGRDMWRDVETAAARAVGPVSVSTCNHHGYFDATGEGLVRALQPKVWVIQSWHASHPAISVLANLYSTVLYPAARDVFCLGLHPAAALACGRFSDHFKSSQGHLVVRVTPGGESFRVLVVEDGDESGRVKAEFGPYPS